MTKHFSLVKSRKILLKVFKNIQNISKDEFSIKEKIMILLKDLEQAIFDKDQVLASDLAKKVLLIAPRSLRDRKSKNYELFRALLFAGITAFLIKQFWFEIYEVPTGSMRPTILEKDRILVSKTAFGLHIPFKKKPILTSKKSLTRGSLVVFSSQNMSITDSNTRYFGIFPGKKRYIKRCIGKPGDTLYFYQGQVIGIDKDNLPITNFYTELESINSSLEPISHVPYISFEGITKFSRNAKNESEVTFSLMQNPIGKLSLTSHQGYFFKDKWIADQPHLLLANLSYPVSYADLFGIKHYGMARLISNEHLPILYGRYQNVSDAYAYLEIYHTPNLTYPEPEIKIFGKQTLPLIQASSTIIPLRKEHLHLIQENLSTSRFIVYKGAVARYQPGISNKDIISNPYTLSFPSVPNGQYEYQKGVCYQIFTGGFRKKLKSHHPLMNLSDQQIIELFNCGISFNSIFNAKPTKYIPLPSRYTFYKQGNLYIMDAPLLVKGDPVLTEFIKQETIREQESLEEKPYIAYIERSIPSTTEAHFVQFIKNFGIKVPDNHILVLGDNYPMSADSREFGFVPIENILGTPIWTLWPISSRFGKLNQISTPLSLTGALINGLVIIISSSIFIMYRRKKYTRLFPK